MFFDCLPDEVVDAQVLAWRARDAATFSEFYAPDAVIVVHQDHPAGASGIVHARIFPRQHPPDWVGAREAALTFP